MLWKKRFTIFQTKQANRQRLTVNRKKFRFSDISKDITKFENTRGLNSYEAAIGIKSYEYALFSRHRSSEYRQRCF